MVVLVAKCLSDDLWRLILSCSGLWWQNGSQMTSGDSVWAVLGCGCRMAPRWSQEAHFELSWALVAKGQWHAINDTWHDTSQVRHDTWYMPDGTWHRWDTTDDTSQMTRSSWDIRRDKSRIIWTNLPCFVDGKFLYRVRGSLMLQFPENT